MKFIFNIGFLVIVSTGIFAQEQDSVIKKLNFNAGFQKQLLLDEQKSALVYQSTAFLAGFGFDRKGPRSVINLSLEGTMGNMHPKSLNERWLYITSYDINGTPDIDSFPVTARMITGKLQFSYLYQLSQPGKVTWLGGFSVKDYLAYPDNYTGLMNSLGIHLKAGMAVQVTKKSMLHADISFPLVSLTTRLPWHNTATDPLDPEIKTFFKKGSRLTGPDKFRMLEFNSVWDIKTGRRWSVGIAYNFTWLNIPYYQPMRSTINSFKVQTAYNF